MGYYVYILSSKDNKYYIGSTKNLVKRLQEHNRGKVRSTKPYIPWILIWKERFESSKDARGRENQLKKWKKRRFLEKMMAHSSSLV